MTAIALTSAAAALCQRSLESQSHVPPQELLEQVFEHHWLNDDMFDKAHIMADLFSLQLGFFGGIKDIAQEAIHGLFLLDEVNQIPKSRMGCAVSWPQCEHPPLHDIPTWLHEQYLKEWIKIPIVHEQSFEYVENAFQNDMTLFHGTISKCAHKIIQVGFLPGPNGHVKNKKYYQGAFMARDFSTACFRSDMTRHVREDRIYDFGSCPCVLEMRTSSALVKNYHKHNADLFVLPGCQGKLLQGLRIEAIHFNHRFVQNYRSLHHPELRNQIKLHGGVTACICGGGRQMNDFCSCGKVSFDPWSEFKKLGKYYVCRDCYKLWR